MIAGKLVLITNRKSYISFRLVPKSVTLNDLNGVIAVTLHYFTVFTKPAFQHINSKDRRDLWWNLCASLL